MDNVYLNSYSDPVYLGKIPQKELTAQETIDAIKAFKLKTVLEKFPSDRKESQEKNKKKLEKLFEGEKEIHQILHFSKSSKQKSENDLFDYMTKIIYALASGVFATLSSCLSSRKLWIMSEKYAALSNIAVPQHNEHLLGTSMNRFHPDVVEFCYAIDSSVSTTKPTEIKNAYAFDHTRGSCAGMCIWFIYLYLKTFNLFENREEHISSVTEIFKNGATKPAVILQMLSLLNDLNMIKKLTGIAYQEYITLSTENLSQRQEEIEQKIKDFPLGIYEILLYGHDIVLIKTDQNTGYLFDPNHGSFHAKH
jgi:hypothetical protein